MRIKISLFLSLKIILPLGLMLIIFSTCTKKSLINNPTEQVSPLLLKISFADASLVGLIDSVILSVFIPETKTSIETCLTLKEGQISGRVEVPAGEDRVFTLEALDSSNTIIYRGVETANVIGGETTEVKIDLLPVVLLLRLSPIYQEVFSSNSLCVDVKLDSVKNLFGVSFRVEYDPAVLVCDSVSSGDFLGLDSTIFFYKVDTGYVAVGYTRIQGDTSGVSGSGTLARLYLRAKAVEGTTLGELIFNRQTLAFYDPKGDLKDKVYIHDAQVLIH